MNWTSKASRQNLGKSDDFIPLLTSQEMVKLKKITCSYYKAVFAAGKNYYRCENGYINSQFLYPLSIT